MEMDYAYSHSRLQIAVVILLIAPSNLLIQSSFIVTSISVVNTIFKFFLCVPICLYKIIFGEPESCFFSHLEFPIVS